LKQVTASITSNTEAMPRVYLTWLEAPDIAAEAIPGQFVMVNCGKDCVLPRPLSVHQQEGNKLAFLFAIVGKGTQWLSQRHAGDKIELLGPLGNGFSIHPDSHNLLLVAGGIGIAPLYFLAREALRKRCSVTLLYGTADNKRCDISSPIKLVSATEDGTVGKKGLVTDLLPDYVNQADQIFFCGPMPMYRNMADNYPQLRGKPAQISLEVRMGCGLGVCYGCTVKTKNGLKQVCKDGPIFDLNEIIWDELGCE